MTPTICHNHRQRDKQINRLKREHISLRQKFVISFNWGKINAIVLDLKSLILPYLSFETKKKLWVGGVVGWVDSVRT